LDLESMLRQAALRLPLLILSLAFHECAHAWSAWKLGDDTAQRQGRLTLNPLPHIDLFGTILLPLLSAPIGWAKPVPIDPARFRRDIRMSTGVMLTSAAGPLSNLLLATICAGVFNVISRVSPDLLAPGHGVGTFLASMMQLNVLLMVFNLLPIPPLDGGGVAAWFVPERLRGAWETFSRFGPLVLIALILLPQSPLSSLIYGPANLLLGALHRLALAS
jgi:Zn-dependent protease